MLNNIHIWFASGSLSPIEAICHREKKSLLGMHGDFRLAPTPLPAALQHGHCCLGNRPSSKADAGSWYFRSLEPATTEMLEDQHVSQKDKKNVVLLPGCILESSAKRGRH